VGAQFLSPFPHVVKYFTYLWIFLILHMVPFWKAEAATTETEQFVLVYWHCTYINKHEYLKLHYKPRASSQTQTAEMLSCAWLA